MDRVFMTRSIQNSRPLLLSLLLPFCVACGASNARIGGQIIDADGTRLSAAKIQTVPATEIVVTNREGHFLLEKRLNPGEDLPIPPGIYEFRVNKEGFRELVFSREIKGGNNWLGKHILEEDQPEIEDVGEGEELEEVNIGIRGGPKTGGS